MITIERLTKKYGHAVAVDDVTFTAAPGRVTGFLGPNGARKSTTMRIMVGLTRATSGTATISGRGFADLPNPGLEVGVLLDASAQHDTTSGNGTLRVDADSERAGLLAHQAGVALVELRAAEGASLEEMSLELTADTQRERAAS